jgi:DNA-binding LacI/PurR family transcriptional regulator
MAFVRNAPSKARFAYYRSLYEAIMRECYAKETRLFYVNAASRLPDFIGRPVISAIFIAGTRWPDAGRRPSPARGTRLVSIDDNTWEGGRLDRSSDNYQCGQLAAERLIARKRVRPLFIGNKHGYGYQPFNERKNGFINRFAKEGVAAGSST